MANLIAGIDIGSTTTKAVLLDEEEKLVASSILNTSYDRNQSGLDALDQALDSAGCTRDDVRTIGATGYGRKVFEIADEEFPEIICHGRGTEYFYPGVRTIVDVGGQDSKVIRCEYGIVSRFEMNDKCAAGTGRFFEVLSNRLLNVPIDKLGTMALASKNPIRLSSMCTIFAESEIVSLLSQDAKPEDICKGILISMTKRIITMGKQTNCGFEDPIVLTGGFARNVAAAPTFEEQMNRPIHTIDQPQLPAAVGVALLTRDEVMRKANL